MNRALQHVRANAVAYLALFVALGGTGYAATNISRNSVGTSQIKNGAVTPPKLNSKLIGGTVRAWAYVSASGHAYISHGFGHIGVRGPIHNPGPPTGAYALDLNAGDVSRCAATGSVSFDSRVGGSGHGYVVVYPPQVRPPALTVDTFDSAGTLAPLPFVVELLC